ncbi:MAG: ATP-binding cassette domain-containing protein, partial [Eubacterium sp.]|nr:ATP-binding cassette domain-containing protein [Eubacterium sp.]
MEALELRGLTFTYPEQPAPALRDVTLTVAQGEFWVLCGPSGCGKTTLLRQLKTVLAPHGKREGDILLDGVPLDSLDQRAQSQKIGFVRQSPQDQLVT